MTLARRAILKLVTAPSQQPVTLDQVKQRLRIGHADDDAALAGMIAAAAAFMDGPHGYLGRCLLQQTWDESFERFPACRAPIALALSPLASVTSVKYFDTAGIEQTIAPAAFEAVSNGDTTAIGFLGEAWPGIDTRKLLPVTVRAVFGVADYADLPAALEEALTVHVGALYETRGVVAALTLEALGYDTLTAPHRRPSL